MDFLALQTRVAEETGLDLQNTDDLSSIKAWINQAYQHVSGLYHWDWTFAQGTIQTVADITSGTASVSAYGSTVALSTAPTVAGSNISVAKQWMINFPDVSADWYFVSAHTSGSTSLTLSVPLASSSNLAAGDYILRKVLYSLPTDCDRLIDIRQQVTSTRLLNVDPRTFDAIMPNPTATGDPVYYSFVGRDSSTSPNWQISLFPTPTNTMNLQVKYYKTITELVSDTDQPILPVNWHDVLVYAALAMFGHAYIDDDRQASAQTRYSNKLADMLAASSHVPDQLTILRPWDSRSSGYTRSPRLPDNYPNRYGI